MYYKYNNIKLYYEKYGNKKKYLLILPGWGNTRPTFYNIINFLKNIYTIYIIDYPGFGNSPIINNNLTIYDYADLIKNFIKDNNIDNPSIIAHSFGGRIASILIGKEKIEVDKLILFDVAGIKHKKSFKLYLKEKIYKFINKITRNRYKEKLNKIFGSSDYKYLPKVMRNTFINIINEDLTKYYKLIKTNTLIIWGEKDQDTPLKDAVIINKLIRSSALIIYKKRGHFSYLEEIPLTNKILYYMLID